MAKWEPKTSTASAAAAVKKAQPEPVAEPPPASAPAPAPGLPELAGYGVAPVGGGWIAYRATSRGEVQLLTPKRAGVISGEKKPHALSRMLSAQALEFGYGRRVK